MILRGLLLLARGSKSGIREFGDDLDSFTSALAPLIAFPLVFAGITALEGHWEAAAVAFLAQLCSALTLPVILYEYAKRTNREALWLRTVVAAYWSVWVAIPVALIMFMISGILIGAGLPQAAAIHGAEAALVLYMLWLQWVVFSAGLGAGRLEALALLVACGVVLVVCTVTPVALGYALHSPVVG